MRREQRPFESRMSVTQRGALALRLSGFAVLPRTPLSPLCPRGEGYFPTGRPRLETRGDFCARFRARAPGKA